jgi:pSer/pThr/pTyr-binding forkhead associated (FHA) protein
MEFFRISCGAAEPLRLDVAEPGQAAPVPHTFEQPYVVVGRDPRSDLRLDHGLVSRRHAYFQVVAGGVFCIDLGSRTGLRWGKRRAPSGWLTGAVRLGPCRVTLASPAPPEPPPGWDPLRMPAGGQQGLPGVALEITGRTGKPDRRPLPHVLTLAGRAADCRLPIPDISVSRIHCSLLLLPSGLWVVDLLSREGTSVNGESVRCARLNHGDVVRLGRVTLRPYYEAAVQAVPPAPAGGAPGNPGPADSSATGLVRAANPPAPPAGADEPAAVVPRWSITPLKAPPALVARADLPAELLGPVLEHVSALHRDLMEQFQQSVLGMAQLLTDLHREQMTQFREELRRVQELTQELHVLREELRRAPPPAVPAAPAAPPRAPSPPGAAGPELHGWLNERIAALEQEREGHWQRILGFMRRR